jgi:arginase family enzyme
MNGVNTPDAQSVRPPDVTPSRITYDTGVFDPEVAPATAAYVTTPVVRFNV